MNLPKILIGPNNEIWTLSPIWKKTDICFWYYTETHGQFINIKTMKSNNQRNDTFRLPTRVEKLLYDKNV